MRLSKLDFPIRFVMRIATEQKIFLCTERNVKRVWIKSVTFKIC